MESTTQIFLQLMPAGGSRIVQGEAHAQGFEKSIELENFSFDLTVEQSVQKAGKKNTSNLQREPVRCSKIFDKSSLVLAQLMNARVKFDWARLFVDQQLQDEIGKDPNPILVIDLLDGFISNFSLRASEGKVSATIREDLTLSYVNFKVWYCPRAKVGQYRAAEVTYETQYENK